MTDRLRLAGRGREADGSILLWSVAEGRRGRRWRAIRVEDRVLALSLLLEVGVDGRPGRLELASREGMLTLHPEPDGRSAHGNVVAGDGVRPLVMPWSGEHEVFVDGLSVGQLIAVHRLASSTGVGEGRSVPVLLVERWLNVRVATADVSRQSPIRWRIVVDGDTNIIEADERGIPIAMGDAMAWPLESEQGSPRDDRG